MGVDGNKTRVRASGAQNGGVRRALCGQNCLKRVQEVGSVRRVWRAARLAAS
jgi:hypothetical protein